MTPTQSQKQVVLPPIKLVDTLPPAIFTKFIVLASMAVCVCVSAALSRPGRVHLNLKMKLSAA